MTAKAPAAEHFHTSFLTLPTTPLEEDRVGVIVVPHAADSGVRVFCVPRESEVKDLVQRHPKCSPSLTLFLWGRVTSGA